MTRANEVPYRTIITTARYTGLYEGGEWIAFIGDRNLPERAFGDDIECSDWWAEWGKHPAVAVADTLEDLISKLRTSDAFDNRNPKLPLAAYEP